MARATVTSKGQVTIPKSVRDALQIESGDRLAFHLTESGVIEIVPETLDLLSLCGSIRPAVRGVTIEEMNEAIRDEAGAE